MKNILKIAGLLGLAILGFTSCENDDDVPFIDLEPGGTIISIQNVQTGFFDLANPGAASVAFDLDVHGDGASNVTIFKSYNGGAPVEHATVSSFSSTVGVTLDEALDGLGVTADDLAAGDNFTLSFEIDGNPAGKTLNVPVSCSSALAGTHTYEVTANNVCDDATGNTGEVIFTEEAAGKYSLDFWDFGMYQDCYGFTTDNWGSLLLVDVCSQISIEGIDSYNDTWTVTEMSTDGPVMTFGWETTTYGETMTVEITREGGEDWPPLFN